MKSCSGVGQGLFHLGGAGHVERCHPAAVRRVGIGPVPNEKPNDRELPAVDGPAQRRLPLGVARVNRCAMIEQCLRYRNVAPARGLVQRRPPGGAACDINGGAGCEEHAGHIPRRGAVERRVTLRLLGIGVGPRAN